MKIQQRDKTETGTAKGGKPYLDDHQELMRGLTVLPGSKILDRVLDAEDPRELIRELPDQDFFWLIKRIGEEECLPLLELASKDQWQHLLDLELWTRDRIDLSAASRWLERLVKANTPQLVQWLLNEGEYFCYYHLFKSLEVVITQDKDEAYDLPPGFFSLDGTYHIRVTDPDQRETLERIIRKIATEDLDRFQALMLGLGGVLPAEVEEALYRSRNIRLAEHGFLPQEEALSLYSPLDPDALPLDPSRDSSGASTDEDTRALAPLLPLFHTGHENMLAQVLSGLDDPVLMEKIRLEFAGLCNQIISADGLQGHELEDLIKTCRKAARLLNLGLDRLNGRDVSAAIGTLRSHSLVTLFQIGFGLSLKLKWEAERWLRGSWFFRKGCDTGFWGSPWGEVLEGLLHKRPRLFVGGTEKEDYRDFEWISEFGDCLQVVRRLMVLDSLLERLDGTFVMSEDLLQTPDLTFHPLIFNLWARQVLGMQPGFTGIPLKQAKRLFRQLRKGDRKHPHGMAGFRDRFAKEFMAYAADTDGETASILRETLHLLWDEFTDEFARVREEDLDGKFSRHLMITTTEEDF